MCASTAQSPSSSGFTISQIGGIMGHDRPNPDPDPNEAYEVNPMPEHWCGPKGWWTVMRGGIPVRHFPKRAGARRYATDADYRASLTEKKLWQDRN
jgi:hypothetical protein